MDAEVVRVGDKDEGTPVRGRAEAGDDGGPIGGDLKPVEAPEVGGVAELRAILVSGRAAEVDDVGHGLRLLREPNGTPPDTLRPRGQWTAKPPRTPRETEVLQRKTKSG